MRKVGNFMFGLLMGGLFGGMVGLLLTPFSGNELRTEIREYSRQVRSDVEQAANARRLELERDLANMRGEVVTD